MDFSFTSDQILIRDTVRQFMEAEMRPVIREYERAEKFPAAEIRRLGELGCCGMLIPEEWGGAGADTISYALMLEEVARVDASTAVALSVTNSVVAVPVWKHGSEAQKEKYLQRLARGEMLGAFCLTEPQAGSDAAAIQTRAARDGDDYVLNGTKSWVTNGGVAGVYIVFAKTDAAAGARRRDRVSGGAVVPGISHQPVRRQDGPEAFALGGNCLRGLPRAGGEPAGRRRAGTEDRARIARRRARGNCGAGSGAGAGRDGSGGPLCEAAAHVRQAARRASGDSVHAGGHADGN